MHIERVRLRTRQASGVPTDVAFALGSQMARRSRDGIEMSFSSRREGDALLFSAIIGNRRALPLTVEWCAIDIASGFAPHAPTQFFKHGYQSWSASYGRSVGSADHPRDKSLEMIRLIHQSEARRPTEYPEGSLSELFTIMEQSGRDQRLLVGFISAAAQLGTISVHSPARLTARALFDGKILAPGQSMAVEPLIMIRAAQPAAQLAERYAARLGATMAARTAAPYQRGWCSWYHYFHDIGEEALRANVAALKRMREAFPLELIQLDDGYQRALGDWDQTNARFPSGLKRIAGEIRDAGFAAGIWAAPFLAARDSQLMAEHPDWLLKHVSGNPLRVAYNPRWTTDQDAFAYALDAGVPAFQEHLRRLFERIVGEFGFSYLKLDFLYAAAAEGSHHDPQMTRAQTLRRGLEMIRQGAGPHTFILGCGCPLGPAIGVVDGMRIGPDVAPYWRGAGADLGAPSTADALLAIVNRSFMHRRLWLNDPDCLMLRRVKTELTLNEVQALARSIAVSGGMLLISDDMTLLGAAESAEFKATAELGMRCDPAAGELPSLPDDLLNGEDLRTLRNINSEGELTMALNMGDSTGSFSHQKAERQVPPRSAIIFEQRR